MVRILNLDNVSTFQATSLTDGGYLPGPKIIPNTCMVRLNWSLTDGKIGHNVMYVNYTGTPALSSAVAQSVFAALTTGANWTALSAMLATTTSLTGVTVLDIRSSTGTAFDSTGAAVPGTAPGVALPDEVAAVVTARTALRGPSGRGRIYIPGWSGTATAGGGIMSGPAVTALTNWAGGTMNGALQLIGVPVIAHPARQAYTSLATGRHFDARPAGNVPITTYAVRDNHWDSQRRRGLK